MDTINETTGKVKTWLVDHKSDIIWYGACLGIGVVAGRSIGKTVCNAMKGAYLQGFNQGCTNAALVLAVDNKDNPELVSAVLDFTTKHSKY